ncbi:CRAL/TRIO domain-containing protein [Rhizopogon vinicolor AM-OR11-026]|uniref:CRAL/TRIO domain-containing protein n=1 Tax=Rhizopogon vinicolor AM-OR11-026 TaxID=1314800 RepID=A0A1B7MZ89_9AGAM|nr:CRAL/TRIO domain-containing protein [Rhizopogon vinicolor AM-OR11-026]
MRSVLQDNHEKLITQYKANFADVCALQSILDDELLPHVVQEIALSDADYTWAKEWISDTATIFRFFRHHKFIRSFTLEAMRNTLIWRLNAFQLSNLPPALFHCLPPPICAPFGHPIVFLRLSEFPTSEQAMMDGFLISLERLRIHLLSLNARNVEHIDDEIILQCIFIVDLEGPSIHSFNLKTFTWLTKEIVSRYPGILAAVFFLNCSWTYARAWSVAKCLLPNSAVSRIFFPSREELLQYCSASALPSDYGGALSPLHLIEDPLNPEYNRVSVGSRDESVSAPSIRLPETLHRQPSSVFIPPRSSLNPFFGYPTLASISRPHMVQPGRRRKRDLLLTLSILWWKRWGTCIITVVYFLIAVSLTRKAVRRLVVRWMSGGLSSSTCQ